MIRRIVVAVGAALFVLAIPAAAWAHVVIDPSEAPKGSYSTLTFKVPNETDGTDTTKLDVQIPTDHPIASISVQPKAGWTYEVKKSKLDTPIKTDDGELTEAVSEITWTGGTIKPGEFDTFTISAGPLPTDTDELVFKTIQTYSDGNEVAWIEPTPADGSEPEHPAPTLKLTAASEEGSHDAAAATDTSAAAPTVSASETTSSSSDDSAKTFAIIAIGVGAIALIVGGVALAKSRNQSV